MGLDANVVGVNAVFRFEVVILFGDEADGKSVLSESLLGVMETGGQVLEVKAGTLGLPTVEPTGASRPCGNLKAFF